MDSIEPQQLARWQREGVAFELLDVRRRQARDGSGHDIEGALWRDPSGWLAWKDAVSRDRPVVLMCAHGQEISQGLGAALRAMGVQARYLQGGFAAWTHAQLARRPLAGSLWVTRERPKIDRIACPWLILRFVDPQARFLYVPASEVLATAERTGALPYDVPGVAFTHVGERCSFDALVAHHELRDPALDRLAEIVRAADTGRAQDRAQAPGLLAISQGLSANFADDHEMLGHGLVIYDALYTWCRSPAAAH